MNFKEKIDKLLSISGKKFNSLYDLEVKSGLGMGTLRKAYDENREPSSRIIWKFLETLSINTDWWETGKGEIYLEKPTLMPKSGDNNGKPDPSVEEAIRNLIEGNTDYILMHKVVILDKYRLVSIEDIEKADKELERKQEQITGLYEIIKTIAGKVPDPIPLPDPVTVKLPEVHKA